jgi:MFS family permease
VNLILYGDFVTQGKEQDPMAKATARQKHEGAKAAGSTSADSRSNPMTPLERRSVGVLASIYGLRILGLFLIFPVFALYAAHLEGHTPFLVGAALGAYGLSQAILQIPLGALSDRVGRKPVIAVGLLVFAIGSVVAALSHSIVGVIIGRAIQGGGAVSAAAMALTADLTREEQRTKAMAVIGITIGIAFLLSMILSPVLNALIGVPGIFWLTAVLACTGIAVLLIAVPTPARAKQTGPTSPQFVAMLKDKQLLGLDFGIFSLHLVLTALFLVIPGIIVQYGGLPASEHWKIYLPVMLVAVLTMAPFMRLTNRGHQARKVLIGSVAVLVGAEALFLFGYHSLTLVVVGLWAFFAAFTLLEASLPSLISRIAPASGKGAAMGIYSASQFLGPAVGGYLGGFLHGRFGTPAVFLLSGTVLVLWLVVNIVMPEPKLLITHLLQLSADAARQGQTLVTELVTLPGVADAVVIPEEQVAYLKVEPGVFDARNLARFEA